MENIKNEFIIPSDVINLVSEGKLYKDIPKTLTYEYMVTKDEELLYSDHLVNNNTVFDVLVKRKIKEDIDVNKLLIGDFNQILLALRISGYGEEYKIKTLDPETNEFVDSVVNLTELKSKPLGDGYNENGEFPLLLPVTNKNITFILPTVGLGNTINKVAEQRMDRFTKTTPYITTKLEYLITSVEGNTDKKYISDFISILPPRDRQVIMRRIDEVEPNIILKHTLISESGEAHEVDFTLGLDFFYPTI